VPAHEASRLHEVRIADRGIGNHEARTEFHAACQLVRLGRDHIRDPNRGAAKRQRVADLDIQPCEQRQIRNRTPDTVLLCKCCFQGLTGLQVKCAVERIGVVNGLQFDERLVSGVGAP